MRVRKGDKTSNFQLPQRGCAEENRRSAYRKQTERPAAPAAKIRHRRQKFRFNKKCGISCTNSVQRKNAAQAAKIAHSSNNFFLRYPSCAMRGGYRLFVKEKPLALQMLFLQPSTAGSAGGASLGAAGSTGRRLRAGRAAGAVGFYKLVTLYYNSRKNRRKNYITVLYNRGRSEIRRTV